MSTKKVFKRWFAAVMAVLMFVSLLPIPVITKAEIVEAITITVKDEKDTPIEGATVEIIIDSVSDNEKDTTKELITDAMGQVEVMKNTEFVENDFTISATVSMEGYQVATLEESSLIAVDQNFDVTLVPNVQNVIEGVSIVGQEFTYDKTEHDAVVITGIQDGDVVTYCVNDGESLTEMPVISNAGTYSIKVTVEREGYETLVETVETIVNRADIDIFIEGNQLAYNGAEQELVSISGDFEDGDIIAWQVDDSNIEGSNIPKGTAVGIYSVKLTVERNENYNIFEKSIEVEIKQGEFEAEGVIVEGESLTYTGEEQEAVKVTFDEGFSPEYTLYYQLDEGNQIIDENAWSIEIPTVKEAGSYIVWVKAVKQYYDDAEVDVSPAVETVAPYNVYVKKAEQKIEFENNIYKQETSNLELEGITPFENQKFDFSASVTEGTGTISYELVLEDGVSDIATIEGSVVTVLYPGVITVKATLAGDENHEDAEPIIHVLTVTAKPAEEGAYIQFENAEVEYVLGENSGVASNQTVLNKNEKDDGIVQYSIDKANIGLSCGITNGEVVVEDYEELAEVLIEAGGTLEVIVTANKAQSDFYEADSARYKIRISFMDTPESPIEIEGTKGDIDGISTEWYVSAIMVTPKNTEYSISSICEVGSFAESVRFENQGADERYVYLRHNETGGITSVIVINEKIDTIAPDNMTIEFSEPSIIERIGDALGFYSYNTTITFKAKDVTSGIDHFNWLYTKEEGASASNLANKEGELDVTIENGVAKAVLTLPLEEAEHMRGNIAFTAVDKAGNESAVKTENRVFVIDNKSPECVVVYNGAESYVNAAQTIGEKHYFNGAVEVTFTITEANFYEEIVAVSVQKDGVKVDNADITINWNHVEGTDNYVGSFILSEDGDYVISINATDKNGNAMREEYMSETIVVDNINPEIGFVYDGSKQTATLTITEKNFRAEDILVDIEQARNILDISVDVNDIEKYVQDDRNWTSNGNVHTLRLESGADKPLLDAIYVLVFDYKDLALRKAEQLETDEFVVDHTLPTNVTITYSEALLEKVLEAITLGFYKANVTVTFTAHDDVAGIDYFTWNYTKENGASTINRDTDTTDSKVAAVQDEEDKTKYTATVTLPNTDVAQLRGYLAVVATDKRTNASEKVTDAGRVIVVDSIAPTMKVEYSLADKVVGSNSYYNNNVEVTFTVTEANFFKDEVKVMVSKDGGTAYAVTPQWTDESVDTHIGKYVLSGDGDYVISVNYTDYSANKMAEYTSNVITIDTVKPVINVKYANTNPSSTLADVTGMQRKYFANKQTATITITEHNFNANDVVLDITTTDVAGKAVTGTGLYTVSDWKDGSEADTHVLEITYAGDANYTFDIAYTDNATNEAVDYATDYFTVDKSAPTDLRVSYSTSVLEAVLETITFGFYNAKVDVTIVAEDVISGINSFAYSYIKAEGVSEVNAEALNQAIAAANITYSNDGKTATARFQIPKEVLSNTTQFNGTITFDAINRSGLKSNLEDDKHIVVDNIAPKAEVTYNEPVVNENGISYYDRDIVVTVVITEANFYENDVVVMVSKDGGAAYAVTPSWNSSNVNLHTGTFTITGDGDYVVTINYRDKSSNEMTEYTSGQLTIDTDIQEPTITFNGNNETGHAYKNEIIPEISFSDINYDTYDVFLYRTYMNAIDVDITAEKSIKDLFTVNEESGSATLDIFAVDENGKYEQSDDGIYRLVVKMTDKAGHTAEKEAVFTVNRYGSVYAFDKYLVELIVNGGAYVKTVTEDLVITEYNADQLVSDSLNIEITRDGKPLEDAKYTVSPTINENVAVGESGWYQYEYVISKENFVADGIYKISISSKDATGNAPENSNYEDKNIVFRVDNAAPEITSIVGLEDDSYDATEQNVSYVVFDAIGLKSIKIYLDGEILEEITDFTSDLNNYSGNFIIPEKDSARTVRLVVEDLAGNITDTDSEDFTSAYTFNSKVTVTTDDMARFMSQLLSNKPLLFGSIAGTVGVAALAGVGIRFRMKRRVK